MDPVTVDRLAGVCRLWGAVKYFHPWLAYRAIDWDAALLGTIPLVLAADSPGAYRAAVDHLLAALDDRLTHTVAPSPAIASTGPLTAVLRPAPEPTPAPHLRWTDDRVAVLVAADFWPLEWHQIAAQLDRLLAEAAEATALVLDLRRAGTNLALLLPERLGRFLERDVALPAVRRRLHSGYVADGFPSSGGYFTGWFVAGGQAFAGRAEPGQGTPIAAIIPGMDPATLLALGLQAAGVASLVARGAVREPVPTEVIELADGLQATLRTGELIYAGGTGGVEPDRVVDEGAHEPGDYLASPAVVAALDLLRAGPSDAPATRAPLPAVPLSRPELPYADPRFPPLEYRLLALFRLWNAVRYCFPYHHLLDQPWDETLPAFLPRFAAAADELAYAQALAELATRLQDTHAVVVGSALNAYFGTHQPPLQVRWIEGQSVVTRVARRDGAEPPPGAVGDVVLAVDGEDIAARRERLGRYLAASTPQARQWGVHQRLLAGAEGSEAELRLRTAAGTETTIHLPRGRNWNYDQPALPVFTVLADGSGYVDLTRLVPAQVDEALRTIQATPAAIFDLRGYPNGTFYLLGARLAKQPTTVARFRRPEPHGPSPWERTTHAFEQRVAPAGEARYRGRVVVLIDEQAISQAEHTGLVLEAVAAATFIGSATNGANGDITRVALPGGVGVLFSGHDVRHADGRQLQRVGILPHIEVRPTIAGVRAGRDEVLEAAKRWLGDSAPIDGAGGGQPAHMPNRSPG